MLLWGKGFLNRNIVVGTQKIHLNETVLLSTQNAFLHNTGTEPSVLITMTLFLVLYTYHHIASYNGYSD